MDQFSHQMVGWSMKDHMQNSLVKDALTMARFRRRPGAGLIFHSDRGSQYCSHEFQNAHESWDMHSSMSRKSTLEWVSWFNHHRLLEPIGYIPRAKAEANYYRQLAEKTEKAD